MKRQDIIAGIHLLLFSIPVGALIMGLLKHKNVESVLYIGLASIVISALTKAKSPKISNYILGIALLLGTFNIIMFQGKDLSYSISILENHSLDFNPLILVLLLLFVSANEKIFNMISKTIQVIITKMR